MQGQTNAFTKQAAKALRKTMTEAEQRLWHRLRGQQMDVKFRRQHPFENYVFDFVCLERRLVIEVDGSQHVNNQHDEQRTQRLNQAGFTVLRFWNNEVLNETDVVVQEIWNALNPSPPQPSP
ncbi:MULTISPECIES: endonuclease domain-containing protein [unclassified Herbaspirillum]|uniref:endonuclease domain-containing protein n=1 Tax=unclassified Herbaspirillum TaxID=2624150 RepID=UPI00114E435A|nr:MULTISPECIES: endonuclease domain-containing protein [unclassified Herbaspirillum]MBB5392742.1 very-short-patch-repair endonuclease [Herbaspirillum sp. SJZ102]TQJ99086.1 very-short-patch-repair endonuclease [Herbaspirillum sp. SJZ130]TQK04099.1 very-short-patch-repair endonuclease [Herbaspirillum sp. SJZ106]TWC68579.1 very-short-patch-repair endonuclease [Herbaspirillum sp. SJZ099]